MAADTDEPLSAGAAAGRLGISVRTLDRWVDRGLLTPVWTPSGHRRFDPAAVAALLAATPTRKPSLPAPTVRAATRHPGGHPRTP